MVSSHGSGIDTFYHVYTGYVHTRDEVLLATYSIPQIKQVLLEERIGRSHMIISQTKHGNSL
jgi:hypothetical protein